MPINRSTNLKMPLKKVRYTDLEVVKSGFCVW